MRTEFGRNPRVLWQAWSVLAAGVVLLLVTVVAGVVVGGFPLRLSLLAIFGLPATALGIYLLTIWLPTYRLTVGTHGIQLQWRGTTIVIAWQEVACWSLDVPATESGQRKIGAGRVALQVQPAAHVSQPDAGPRRTIWARRWHRWVVCEPDLTDGTVDEIAVAMRNFAGPLEAHVVASRTQPGTQPAGQAQATIGMSQVLRDKARMSVLMCLVVLALPIGITGAFVYSRIRYGFEGPDVTGADGGIEWSLVAFGVFMGGLILVAVVLSIVELGYLWYSYLKNATVTVTAAGLQLRSRWYDVLLPWNDVEYWTVGTGSTFSTTFFMGVRHHPNLFLRRPVRDVILAKPAAHVLDPAAPPFGTFWSARHGAWQVCKVSHANATTGEIFNILRHFASRKEADHKKVAPVSAVSSASNTDGVGSFGEALIGSVTSYQRKIRKTAVVGGVAALLLTYITIMLVSDLADGTVEFVLAVSPFLLLLSVVLGVCIGLVGYLVRHVRARRSVAVGPEGVVVRGRNYEVPVAWRDVEFWTIGQEKSWLASVVMRDRLAPDPTQRSVEPHLVLARPARHVTDPAAGAWRELWSPRHQAWLICRVAHSTSTTTGVLRILRHFASGKEAPPAAIR